MSYYVERELLLDPEVEDGENAFLSGMSEADCPHVMSDKKTSKTSIIMIRRCAWLAGYRDAERGMSDG